MTQQELDQLRTLLSQPDRWCQHAEARDRRGSGVRYSDSAAVAWDITGAVCHLFGWSRALQLFTQLDRHVTGHKPLAGRYWRHPQDAQLASMAALQEFNDRPTTSHESLMGRLAAIPIHRPRAPASCVESTAADESSMGPLARGTIGEPMATRVSLTRS